jgi:hypothetical protein
MRFRNPRQRRMEGRFSAVLPEGATISRFAKEVDGHLMEGEVVERLRAHQDITQDFGPEWCARTGWCPAPTTWA